MLHGWILLHLTLAARHDTQLSGCVPEGTGLDLSSCSCESAIFVSLLGTDAEKKSERTEHGKVILMDNLAQWEIENIDVRR